jgi:hypothetical protein
VVSVLRDITGDLHYDLLVSSLTREFMISFLLWVLAGLYVAVALYLT